MSQVLNGKIALVTGSSRGIGRAIAQALAADGALVAIHYGGNRAAAEDAVAQIQTAGGQAFAIGADLSKPEGPKELFESLDRELIARTGANRFDILVNNAGVAPFATLAATDDATFETLFQVNIRSVFFITQLAESRLRDGGRVINLSSAVTRVGVPDALAYSASKGWVDSFTRSLAAGLAPRNIAVNAIQPGVIETDMAAPMLAGGADNVQWILSKQALKRLGQAKDIAGIARFLAGPDSAWVTGQLIDGSGGSQIAF